MIAPPQAVPAYPHPHTLHHREPTATVHVPLHPRYAVGIDELTLHRLPAPAVDVLVTHNPTPRKPNHRDALTDTLTAKFPVIRCLQITLNRQTFCLTELPKG